MRVYAHLPYALSSRKTVRMVGFSEEKSGSRSDTHDASASIVVAIRYSTVQESDPVHWLGTSPRSASIGGMARDNMNDSLGFSDEWRVTEWLPCSGDDQNDFLVNATAAM